MVCGVSRRCQQTMRLARWSPARALAITAVDSDTHAPWYCGAGVRGIGADRLSRCPRGNSPGPSGWHADGRAELLRTDGDGGARRFGTGVAVASGGGAESGRIAPGPGE